MNNLIKELSLNDYPPTDLRGDAIYTDASFLFILLIYIRLFSVIKNWK